MEFYYDVANMKNIGAKCKWCQGARPIIGPSARKGVMGGQGSQTMTFRDVLGKALANTLNPLVLLLTKTIDSRGNKLVRS